METYKVRTHVGPDGAVNLTIPVGLPEREVEVEVAVHNVDDSQRNELGWPKDYFEQTYGSFRGQPLVRPEQGEFEVRRPFP